MMRTRTEAGLRPRLFALVLVPIVLLGGLTWSMVTDRRDRATSARVVQRQITDISSLVDVTRQLLLARTPVEVEVRAGELGLSPQQALDALDVDQRDLGEIGDLHTLAATLRLLPADLRPFEAAEVEALADQVDAGATTEQLDAFDDLQERLDVDWKRQVAELRVDIVDLGDVDLSDMADDVDASADAGLATANLIMGLSDHWFSSLDDGPPSVAGRVRLATPAAEFDAAIAHLSASADPTVVASAREIAALRADGSFGAAIQAALDGEDPAPFADGDFDLDALASAFTDGFSELGPLLDLVQGRTNALASEADRAAKGSERSADLALVAMGALIAAVLALSLAVTASFLRPLRRLIDAMRAVGAGDLSGEELVSGGPPEVRSASAAFNDVLVNLRLLEGKVEALARADLDDPRLGRSLPGALGRELDDSIGVLAGSIAERAQLQERLEHQATHDPLTGIANRAGARSALEGAAARAHRHGTTLAVAFVDLDGFKAVNDRHGHAAGDAVLVEVAARLDRQARTGDTCARMGGDEFVVIAEHMGTRRDAEGMGKRMADAISQPIELPNGVTARIGASIGIALSDAPNESPSALLHRADLAAYAAKRDGSVVRLAPDALTAPHDQLPMPATDPPVVDPG